MSDQIKGSTFEELYLEQRKKNQVLLIVAIALAVSTAGSLAWNFSKSNNINPTGMPGNFQGQGLGGQGTPGGMGGMRGGMGMDIKQFFNDDGSVNTSQVESFTNRIPSGSASSSGFNFLDRFKDMIDQSVEGGDITQEQADALVKAFESESEDSKNES